MLRMLKTVYILLKVLMLTRAAIANSSENPEDGDISITNYHYIFESEAKFQIVKNYSDSVTVKDKAEGSPSEPRFPRAFVEFDNRLNEGDNIIIKFRWKKPINGVIQGYTTWFWSIENQMKSVHTIHNISATTFQIIVSHQVFNITPDMLYFQVQAHNEVGAGPYTKFIKVSTTHENPVPLSLINLRHSMRVLDMDSNLTVFTLNRYRAKEIIYSALENKIYWINEKWQLISSDFNPLTVKIEGNHKITTLDASAYNLCIDWIARNLYWIEIDNQTRNIMKLDLTLWQQTGIPNYNSIVKINKFKFLNILPSRGYFHWIELNSYNQYVIMHSDLDGKNIKPFSKNEYDRCSCKYNLLNASSMQIDNTTMYWTWKDCLFAADFYGCECKMILRARNQTFFNYLTIDKTNIYLFSNSSEPIYILKKEYALLESKEDASRHLQKVPISLPYIIKVIALDRSLQSYHQTMCLVPKKKDYQVEVLNITANSIVVSLPEPIPNSGCEKYNLATTIYNISVSHCLDNNLNEFKEFNVQTHERQYKIQNLTPFTEYRLKLALSNFCNMLSFDLQFGAVVIRNTTADKLNAPENVTVQVLTPTLAAVYWMPPKKLNCAVVNYEVYWISVLVPNGTRNITYQMPRNKKLINKPEHTGDGKVFTKIQLLPGQEYLIYVRVYPGNFSDFFTDSSNKSISMYSEPNNLTVSGVSTNGMNISWIPSVNLTIHYILEYKRDAMQKWKKVYKTKKNNDTVTYYIEDLLPRTKYKFRLILRYPEYMEDFIWPPDEGFTFQTIGNVPSAPRKPTVTELSNTYQLNWVHAQAHDSPVTLYQLQGRLVVENNCKECNQIDKNEWILCYKGTDNSWVITRNMTQKYRFRVKARNAYGFGVWSESSDVVDLTEYNEQWGYSPLLLICLVLSFVIYFYKYVYCPYQQRKATNEQVPPSITTDNIQSEQFCAPRLQYNMDEFGITKIKKKQINRSNLILGSGTIGQVFQGTIKSIEGSNTMSVAIKMLRENASSQEKMKFSEEADLMSDFRHKHVLRLLGICSDPPLLILELMEADLLKYLRKSRTLKSSHPHALRLQDLLAMCEDVAQGCCYLEKLGIVHKDLACRNCLVSARNRENRIVKIGNFLLDSDIYMENYCLIKGKNVQHFIPWMAPECLKYQKFTSQSDVWAFGVLMLEITSLGEQLCSVKNNSEISQYMSEGIKLLKPLNCPPTLYELMQQCWNVVANDRPKFTHCLQNILNLRDNTEDAVLSSIDINRPVKFPPSGQIEDLVGSTANASTLERLTANDTSNDVIEPLT